MSLFKESALFIKGSVREPLRLEKSDVRFVVGACSNKKCRNRFKDKIDEYWANQAGEEIRKERNKEENDS